MKRKKKNGKFQDAQHFAIIAYFSYYCFCAGHDQQNLELKSNEPGHDYDYIWEGTKNEWELPPEEIQTSECAAYASVLKRAKEIQTVECVAYASVPGTT